MSNAAQIRALAQQIHALATDQQVKEWAQDIYDASPDPVEPPVEPPPAVALTLYEHDQFVGAALHFVQAVPNFAALGFNDRASSAIAVGRWEVFQHANYGGARVTLEPGEHPSLRALGFNDTASSARPLSDVPKNGGPKYFGYFGSDDAQVNETRDHANLLFAAWGTEQQLAARISNAAMPAILDVSDCLFTPSNVMPRHYLGVDVAAANLRRRLGEMQAAGVLPLIVCLYVIDEPERESNVGAAAIELACATCRTVAREFWISPALHICYGDGRNYPGAEFLDWIGCNDYDGDSITQAGQIELRPYQRLVLYPGGADPWREHPGPFYDYAQGNPAVIAIIPFLWVAYGKPVRQGIRSNGMAEQYRAIGKLIKSQETL